MRKSIHKYPLSVADEFTIEMPIGARLLDVQEQHGQPCLWALVATQAPTEQRHFALRGTGHPAEGLGTATHVGTFQMQGGALVFHLFERQQKGLGEK